MRKLMLLVMLLIIVASLPVMVSAQDTIAVGETVTGEVTNGVVEAVFSAEAGEVVVVSILTDGWEPDLEINDADGWEVDFTFGGDNFAGLVFVAEEAGNYTILSQDFLDPVTGSYTLSLSAAGTIAAGEIVEGTIDVAPMAYTFQGKAGTLVAANVTTEGISGKLTLIDSTGDTLKYESTSDYSPNTAVEFLLPEDGIYVVAVELGSFTDSLTGTFSLGLSEITPTILAYDTPTPIEIVGVERQYVAFKAIEGNVVHISANSGSTEEVDGIDVEFSLVGPDGEEWVTDSSDGPGFDPAITRIILNEGFYLLIIIPEDDEPDQTGSVDILVETTDLLLLDDGPVTITLGDRFEQDFLRFNATEGVQYRITVVPNHIEADVSVNIGTDFWGGDSSFSGSDIDQMVVDFTAEETAMVNVSVRENGWDSITDYTVSLEVVE
jgi:hypothetical protein